MLFKYNAFIACTRDNSKHYYLCSCILLFENAYCLDIDYIIFKIFQSSAIYSIAASTKLGTVCIVLIVRVYIPVST